MYEEKYMKMAFEEAKKAFCANEVPIGAVIVKNGKVISTGFNMKNQTMLVYDHAEMIAIRKANRVLNNWRLVDCDIYVTLEPCPMCMSAIQQSRIKNVYYGISNSDNVNRQIIDLISKKSMTNPGVFISGGHMEKQIELLLTAFFKRKRN